MTLDAELYRNLKFVRTKAIPDSSKVAWQVGRSIYVSDVVYSLLLTDTESVIKSLEVVDAPDFWTPPKKRDVFSIRPFR